MNNFRRFAKCVQIGRSIRLYSARSQTPAPEVEKLKSYETIQAFARKPLTPVNLQQFTVFGKTISRNEKLDVEVALHSCQFLKLEIATRLAHVCEEISGLPVGLRKTEQVSRLHSLYQDSFFEFYSFPENPPSTADPDVHQYVDLFTQMVKDTLDRHSSVVITMAQGVQQFKKEALPDELLEPSIQYFLDRFFMNRIGMRMLMCQHIAILEKGDDTNVGIIEENCLPGVVARDAGDSAKQLCQQTYSMAPNFRIVGDVDATITYAPGHLYYIVFELMKNSMRAVMEKWGEDCDESELPEIEVRVASGQEDVSLRISDFGGGIPRSAMEKLFTYMYTTASTPEPGGDINHVPLAGYGYGLALSRLFARYFGGDMHIVSMEGYGTDAYVYLKSQASDAGEVLPSVQNWQAIGKNTTLTQVSYPSWFMRQV